MSRSRMKARARQTPFRIARTRNVRRAEACRVVHWSPRWQGRTFTDWRRPMDQDVRVAFVNIARCRVHRGTDLCASVVITRVEEHRVRDAAELNLLAWRKVLDGQRTLLRELVPFRHRRETFLALPVSYGITRPQ